MSAQEGGALERIDCTAVIKKFIVVRMDSTDYIIKRVIDRGDQLTERNNVHIGTFSAAEVPGGLAGCDRGL